MSPWDKALKILLGTIAAVVVANLVFLDYHFVNATRKLADLETQILTSKQETKLLPAVTLPAETPKEPLVCPATCSQVIDTAIKNIPPAPKITFPAVNLPKEFYIPLGSGSVNQNNNEANVWVDVPGARAVIDTANYPGLKGAYFEAVLAIPNSQGELRARLVETTLPFVYGDYVKTQSGTGELVSVPVILQSGRRTYKVQLYTSIAPGTLGSARIRIVM